MSKEIDAMSSGFGAAIGSIIASDPTKFSTCFYKQNREVIKITPEGEVLWNGREIESDDEFKLAMLDLKNCLMGVR
jgi:hypothetical protein